MKPTIQIIGTQKDAATRRAIRFFKERGVGVHIVDLNERRLERRELENIARGRAAIDLIDREGAEYRRKGLEYMEFDPIEELLDNPLFLKIPVVRNGSESTIGEEIDRWKQWLAG
ncbi:MAG TPA: ArsC family transcriptional regulator [Spirochaetia bacterium]|nr:ArsC family transcriptional regulator [Spirochaetia bacterium]